MNAQQTRCSYMESGTVRCHLYNKPASSMATLMDRYPGIKKEKWKGIYRKGGIEAAWWEQSLKHGMWDTVRVYAVILKAWDRMVAMGKGSTTKRTIHIIIESTILLSYLRTLFMSVRLLCLGASPWDCTDVYSQR